MRYKTLSSHCAVKASVLFAGVMAAVSLGAIGSARATTIDLDLGTPPHVTSKVTNSFDAMNGIALQGQTLSLDFRFSHGEFVRLFTITNNPLFVGLLKLQTNSPVTLDSLSGTGFLVDQHGNPLQSPQELGIASEDGLLGRRSLSSLAWRLVTPFGFLWNSFRSHASARSFVAITGEEFLLMSDSIAHSASVPVSRATLFRTRAAPCFS